MPFAGHQSLLLDMQDKQPKEIIGFVGLGIMGSGMARNVLRAGYELHVWNRTPERMEPLVEAGAIPTSNPASVAARADVVITCVGDTSDVQEVVLGPSGVCEGARHGTLLIDTSTISPSATVRLAGKLGTMGVHMLDAPISGGSEGAVQGTLSIMVGGEQEQFDRALPVLQAMGNTITHVGGHGSGQTVKLVNQILVVGTMLAVSEALVFAEAGGLDLEKMLDAVKGGAAGSWMLSNRGSQAIARDFRPGFTIDLQQKDLRLVLEAADEYGVPVPATALCFQFYRSLQKRGLGADGNHALIKAIEHLSDIQVGAA